MNLWLLRKHKISAAKITIFAAVLVTISNVIYYQKAVAATNSLTTFTYANTNTLTPTQTRTQTTTNTQTQTNTSTYTNTGTRTNTNTGSDTSTYTVTNTSTYTNTNTGTSYIITASIGNSGGSISPSGTISVSQGSSQTFTISPSSGFEIVYVIVDGVYLMNISSYTFTNINANHTITAYFTSTYFQIFTYAGPNGSINPNGPISVKRGTDKTFTITPNTGYQVESVVVDNVNIGKMTSYTFQSVQQDHSIKATFSEKNFTITASSDTTKGAGFIDPDGVNVVKQGASLTFSIIPNIYNEIADVKVDLNTPGVMVSVGKVSIYTFSNVQRNYTIIAYFVADHWIHSSAEIGGTIQPAGKVLVKDGEDKEFTIVPDNCMQIDQIIVDGKPTTNYTVKDGVGYYTFKKVVKDHTIHVSFKNEDPPPTPTNLKAKAISPNRIDLSWKISSNKEYAFIIYRSTNADDKPSPATEIGQVSDLKYSDTDVDEDTTYYYYVKAFNCKESGNSNQASAKTPADLKDIIVVDYDSRDTTVSVSPEYDPNVPTQAGDQLSSTAMNKRNANNYDECNNITISALRWQGSMGKTMARDSEGRFLYYDQSYNKSFTLDEYDTLDSESVYGAKDIRSGTAAIMIESDLYKALQSHSYSGPEHIKASMFFQFKNVKYVVNTSKKKIHSTTKGCKLTLMIPLFVDNLSMVYDKRSSAISFAKNPDGSLQVAKDNHPDCIQWMGYDVVNAPKNEDLMSSGGECGKISARDIFSFATFVGVKPDSGESPAFTRGSEVYVTPVGVKQVFCNDWFDYYTTYTNQPFHSLARIACFAHEFHHVFRHAVLDKKADQYVCDAVPDQDGDELVKGNYFGIFRFSEDSKKNGFSGDKDRDHPLVRDFEGTFAVPKNDEDAATVGVYNYPVSVSASFYPKTTYITSVRLSWVDMGNNTVCLWEQQISSTTNNVYCQILKSEPNNGVVTVALKIRKVLKSKGSDPVKVPDVTMMVTIRTKDDPWELDADEYSLWYVTH